MKVVVATSDVPFARGGHRVIAESLVQALLERGVEATVLYTPQNRFGRQAAAYLATWLTDVGRAVDGARIDQVITLRFPAYALRHERHVCWLLHRMREYYDLWPDLLGPLGPAGRVKERVRRLLIHAADRYLLRRVTRLFALSATVQAELRRWGSHESEVLYPPPPPRAYRCEAYDGFVFAPSRLHPLKRQDLLVEALARTPGLDAVIAGEGEAAESLAALVRERGLEGRCRLVGRVNDEELLGYYARCRAVFFAPRREDFGFVTAEAFASGKPVITCTDSGGAAEIVEDRRSGFVVDPEVGALAGVLAAVREDRGLAERLGTSGRARVSALTWDRTVDRLLQRG
ncbi:MAG: glycosyltransferase family 4 protein [Acidobacteria bacterium]|nr:glycosyltransferase family 4 protein [Acidobacteriota bacterium]